MLIVSLALAAAAVGFFVRSTYSRLGSALIASAVLLFLFMVGFYVVADRLGGQGIDDAVLFHLRAGIPDAGLSEFSVLIAVTAVYLAVILLLAIAIYRWSWVDPQITRARRFGGLGAVLLLLAFVANPGVRDVYQLSSTAVGAQVPSVAPDSYWLPDPESWALNNRNVVYVYLESFERTYLDEDLFPGLTPNLTRLEEDALVFTDVMQTFGAGFTMAGIVSTLCGVPLVTASHGNSMFGVDQFLPEAVCLSDLLNDQGYNLNYLGGASLNFAGKGNFFNTHGFRRVEGRAELRRELSDPSYMSAWGLYDDTLFDIATARFDELAAGDEPFGLFMLTLDTHHPRGHVSHYCQSIQYEDGTEPMLNAVHCADQMVAEFVAHVQSSAVADNTIIVINSDHLAMPNTVWDRLQQGTRRNLLMYLGPDIEPQRITRPAVLVDAGPTLLSLLGAPIDGLGFGRNLLASVPTLAELKDDVYRYLASQRGFLSSLWNFPQLDDGLHILPDEAMVSLQERSLRLPVLLTLDEDLSVDQVRFEFDSRISLVRQLSQFDYDQRFIWVDGCDQVMGWADRSVSQVSDHDRWCVALGALGSAQWQVIPVQEPTSLSAQDLRQALAMNAADPAVAQSRQEGFNFARAYGFSPPPRHQPEAVLTGSFVLASSGGPMGQSVVDTLAQQPNAFQPVTLRRGISLLGFNVGAQALLLQHFDTCVESIESLTGGRYRFQDDIEALKGQFGAFAIVVHDSAVCDGRDLSSLFEGSGLTEWTQIGLRTPYIGLIAGNGAISEFTGEREARVVIQADDFVRPRAPSQSSSVANLQGLPFVSMGVANALVNQASDEGSPSAAWGMLLAVTLQRDAKGDLRCFDGDTVCQLDALEAWLQHHPAARVVARVDHGAVEVLTQLALEYPDLAWRIVPRVLVVRDYFEARRLGYADVIFDVQHYDTNLPVAALGHMDLFALAMPAAWAERGWAETARALTGVMTYAYTVDTMEELSRLRHHGIVGVFTHHLQQPVPLAFTLSSVGGPDRRSTITRLGDQQEWVLSRGINLIGWDRHSEPQVLAHFDTCAAQMGQAMAYDQRIAAVMQAQYQHFVSWAVIAHDSAVCGESTLAEVFADTPFAQWDQLGLRQPYIAIMTEDGAIHEMIGEPSSAIAEDIVMWHTANSN